MGNNILVLCGVIFIISTAFAQKTTIKELDWVNEDGSCRGKNCLNVEQHQWLYMDLNGNKTDKIQNNKLQPSNKEHYKNNSYGVVLKMD